MAGVLWSLALILCCIVAGLLCKGLDESGEIARKVVHIGVCNWYFIYAAGLVEDLHAIVALSVFAVVNFALLGKVLGKRSLGLALYPVSVILMIVFIDLGLGTVFDLGCGLLVMGYGDGFAALIGKAFGKKKISKKSSKTLLGSVVMFLVSFIVLFLMCLLTEQATVWVTLGCSLVALAATLVEAFTPGGVDNITVCAVVFFLMEALL